MTTPHPTSPPHTHINGLIGKRVRRPATQSLKQGSAAGILGRLISRGARGMCWETSARDDMTLNVLLATGLKLKENGWMHELSPRKTSRTGLLIGWLSQQGKEEPRSHPVIERKNLSLVLQSVVLEYMGIWKIIC